MLFKVLNTDGTSCNGGDAQWSLPVQKPDGTWTPGDWMPAIEGELVPCENGYHLAEDAQVLEWLGPLLCEAEYRGERVDADSKVVVREARLLRSFTAWNETAARTFARWCALQVTHLWNMPAVVREYLETGNEELGAAAGDAAGAAARAAAGAAAGAAARAAARAAAWAAARDDFEQRVTALFAGEAALDAAGGK